MRDQSFTDLTKVVLGGLLMLAPFLSGCTGTWGSLRSSPDLLSGIESRSLDPAFAYYYCGRDNLPYAVVGIDKAYTFGSKFWFRIETMEEVYKKIDHLADLEPHQYRRYAKDILAPDGRKVGSYFSYYFATGVSVDESTRTVIVHNPYKPDSRMDAFP